jgi:hypothetical protein
LLGVFLQRAGRDDLSVERTTRAGDRRDREAVPGDYQLFTGAESADEGCDIVGEACYVDSASVEVGRQLSLRLSKQSAER